MPPGFRTLGRRRRAAWTLTANGHPARELPAESIVVDGEIDEGLFEMPAAGSARD